MNKLILAVLLIGVSFAVNKPVFAASTSVDALINKLIDKGVLTKEEARDIKAEVIADEKILSEDQMKQQLPSWVRNLSFKGDLRTRFQYKHDKATSDLTRDTNTGAIRMRLGIDSKINDKLNAGIGIATGSGNPRSTNITLGTYSSKKNIYIDYGFAKYSPLAWVNIVGGKMLLNDVLWEPTDLIWDTDITPEGGILQLTKKLDKVSLFLNAGVLLIDSDTSTDNDAPTAYIAQPGFSYKFNDDISIKTAVSLQSFDNINEHVSSSNSAGSNSGNTTAGTSRYMYDYSMINPAVELKVMNPFKAMGLGLESIKLFGEYVDNLSVSEKSTGYSAGIQLGNDKINKWGDWQFKYIYAMLGKDSVLDILPDSDRYGGKTGVRSHEGILSFGLGKNTFLGFDLYRSERIGTAKAPETLGQIDWNLKF
ncbi:MAG: putative porin [Candidatus Omnitrophica bacterium]|nr:putative porin [Candidatus Omnitrophota bacterium]